MHHIPWSQLNFLFYFTSHNFLLPHSEKLPLFLASLKVLVSKGTFYTFVAFLKNLHQQLLSFGSSQASTNRLSLQVKKINPIMMLPLHLRSRFWGNSMFHGQPTSRLAIWLCFLSAGKGQPWGITSFRLFTWQCLDHLSCPSATSLIKKLAKGILLHMNVEA